MKKICSIIISFVLILNMTSVSAIAYQSLQDTAISIQPLVGEDLFETSYGFSKPFARLIGDSSKYPVYQQRYFAADTTDGSSDYGYNQLSTNEKQAYSRIKSAAIAKSVNTTISLQSLNLSADQLYKVFCYFRNDNPQYFWLEGGYSYYQSSNIVSGIILGSLFVNGNGLIDTSTINSIQKDIDKTVEVYLNAVKNETDAFNIELILHDMIVQNIYYNTAQSNDNHSIYGVFVKKTAVCEGYAKAFQYLLNLKGIDNIFVTGEANGVGHAWNCVNINGSYFFVDVTWDDPMSSTEQIISHRYFNIKRTQLDLDHITDAQPDLYTLPSCTATAENYFVKKEYYYTNTTNFVSKAISNIVSQVESGNYRAQIQADSLSTLNALENMLVSGGYATSNFASILNGVNAQLQAYQKNSITYSYYKDTTSNILMFNIKRIASNGADKTNLAQKIIYSTLYFSNGTAYEPNLFSSFSNALAQAEATNMSSTSQQAAVNADLQFLQSALNSLAINPFIIVSYTISGTNLTNISHNLTVDNFKLGLSYSKYTELIFKNASGTILLSDSIVGTGTTLTVKIDGVVAYTYTLIIYGDVSGDGNISVTDLVSLKQHLLKVNTLVGAYFASGDIYLQGHISISNLLAVKKHILGISFIQ